MRNTKTTFSPLYLVAVGVVLILGVLVWQLTAGSSPGGTSNFPSSNANLPYPDITRITLADAKAAYDQQSAVFLDVRDADSYKSSHITGAINIPLSDIETRAREIDPNKWIIAYCT